MSDVTAVITTKGRPEFLTKALTSVGRQSLPPSRVFVIGETSEDFGVREVPVPQGRRLRVTYLLNRRAANLSGALNTALAHLVETRVNPDTTYVAFLDDDDTWEPDYLQECLAAAEKHDLDMVVAGIIRHEQADDAGVALTIPTSLTVSRFLVTNPHVQGSNLFVRLSTLLCAGCFDEHLLSTTDRDLCIRLLDLGDLKYGSVPRHLVHHWATGHERLSTPGSFRKKRGLEAFYRKYRSRMTTTEQEEFIRRSREVFHCEISTSKSISSSEKEKTEPIPSADAQHPCDFVVGFTATWLEATAGLLRDLSELSSEIGGISRLVVCDNTDDRPALQDLTSRLTSGNFPVRVVTKEEVEKDAEAGKFGTYYVPRQRRSGIAYGRTVLHHYLYLESQHLRHPVVWILDDDVRLDQLCYGNLRRRINSNEFLGLVRKLREDGYAIAVGSIIGDPPLPSASMIRTQLLDLMYNLHMFSNGDNCPSPSELLGENDILAREYPEHYYDLSIRHHGHLETPFWFTKHSESSGPSGALEEVIGQAPLIGTGVNIFRPIIPHTEGGAESVSSSVPTRGGNTLVFDTECLKTYPNVAPRLGGIDCRRGDTIWCLLNMRVGGLKVGRRTKRVAYIPLHVRQDRSRIPSRPLSLVPVLADIYGGALTRALDRVLAAKVQSLPQGAFPRETLQLSSKEISDISEEFENLIIQRLTLLQMNAWRIRGLVATTRQWLSELSNQSGDTAAIVSKYEDSLRRLLDSIEEAFSREAIDRITDYVTEYPRSDLRGFLGDLASIRSSYTRWLLTTADAKDIEDAKAFLTSHFGKQKLRLIGEGNEGLVFTDGILAYKHFHHGTAHFLPDRLQFLNAVLSTERGWEYLPSLTQVAVHEQRVIFVYEFVEGPTYSGGRIYDILGLLRECRQQGVAITNISPENLIVGVDGLRFTDLGISIEPLTPRLFREMCKRAYLVYRWHFREDLKELLRESLRNDDLPELFGFQHFLAALGTLEATELLYPALLRKVIEQDPPEVFDFGCGSGVLADKMAEKGIVVTAYDIDETSFVAHEPHRPGVSFLGPDSLGRLLGEGRSFDCIVCNLVLCTIADGKEFQKVLDDIRQLIASEGRVLLGICNPFNLCVAESETHTKERETSEPCYDHTFEYHKTPKTTGSHRVDVHRPFRVYLDAFHKAGLEIEELEEVRTTDILRLCPASDFLMISLRPLKMPLSRSVSLVVRASAMEWRTVTMQLRHIIRQLEGPQRFLEKIVVTDEHEGPFARHYDSADFKALLGELELLQKEGTIDRVVVVPQDGESVRSTYSRWFGVEGSNPRCENGQPTHTTLYGFDQCRGDYILQMDSDCFIVRLDRNHDYLGDMIRVLENDPMAVTVSFPIARETSSPYAANDTGAKWRTEVKCGLFSRRRLEGLLPLPNKLTPSGQLRLPWHRSLDEALGSTQWQSYRGGDCRTFFFHMPKERERDINGWLSILKAAEEGYVPGSQNGVVDLVGTVGDWIGRRSEDIVFVVRGRNVAIPRLRRCIDSLKDQRDQTWGVIFIDAASDNGMDEFLGETARREFGSRMTFYLNLVPVTPIQNINFAIRDLLTDDQTIVAMLDADDALIGSGVVDALNKAYMRGADVTVGSMMRTDKHREYPVHFDDSRGQRGGNVWQHMRSFRRYLFLRIPEDYLMVDGSWVPHTEDWAFMIPIVEMAEKPVHIAEPLYFYEPSPDKGRRSTQEREALIAKILAKPSLRRNDA